jgi:octaprenyl-diphosphate synthase
LQIEKARDLDITEEIYYEIIRQKTATLLAACCALGAQSVDAPKEKVENMHRFGELLGMAFQIKDDLFDYGERKIGKPIGIDIKEKKMTLPLIYTLNTVSQKEKRAIINTVKNNNKDKKKVNDLIALVKAKGGLDFAIKKMEEYKSQAKHLLSDFPKNEYRDALELMLNYVTERKI